MGKRKIEPEVKVEAVQEFLDGKSSQSVIADRLGIQEDLLEEGTATHSSILAWRILWTEEPGRLQPIVLQTVRHS